MRSLPVAAISWLLAAQAAAVPSPLNGRSAGYGLSLNATSTRVRGACPARSPTASATIPGDTSAPSVPIGAPNPSSSAFIGNPDDGPVSSLYYSNTGALEPQDLPLDNINRIMYAFGVVASDGTVSAGNVEKDLTEKAGTNLPTSGNNVYGRVRQLNLVKRANRHVKVLLSLGGWGNNGPISAAASSETGRHQFATSVVKLVTDWGFDGIDLDWEYVTTQAERDNVILLLKATREAFDTYSAQNAGGYRFLITYASPAGAQNYEALNIQGMDPYVDTWNLMTYDFAGGWSQVTAFQSNLYPSLTYPKATVTSTDTIVKYYLSQGIAPSKLHVGLPLYGHAFDNTTGLGESFNGTGPGEDNQGGNWSYKDLPRPGAKENNDFDAVAAWSYDPVRKEIITYDNVGSAYTKALYILSENLGGAFFWEANDDKPGNGSLVDTVARSFLQLSTSQNLLSYPTSKYDNIRSGSPTS
ncbi:Chitinase 4 [Sporothrix eucalyptigena]